MAEAVPIWLAEGWTKAVSVGDWTIPGEPAFAESEAFTRLLRDLRLYVRDEISGRSFLIAGHRGAGKTTTVVQAVRHLRNDLLSRAADPDSASIGRRFRLQRPLIVKLVGKSLLEAPPRQAEVEQRKELDRLQELSKLRQAGFEVPAAASLAPAADPPHELAASALVHITIALYRALADEIAWGYAAHAASTADDRGNRMELAAQLTLELDGSAEPGLLRSYWDRVGRLEHGVLWPARADQTMSLKGLHGQGAREIVAVATGGQAFQVCSGAVFHKVSSQEVATHERTIESKVDVKGLVNRVATLGAGTLAGSIVGVSDGGGALLGVGTGILVWLLSGLVLNWSSTRKRKSERTLDYVFMRDRSIQTLDRDLPLVIERIREAGLAPVFVIDELDKLEKEDTVGHIKEIINRLKHLVADYGFFCFLTDRDYFDQIERTVAEQAYPTEHTYFSQRLLVLNRSDDLFQYLRRMLKADGEMAVERKTAIHTFALAMIFRSRLNFTDLNRILARFIRPDKDGDMLSVSEAELLRAGELKLAASFQLAIDQVVLDLDLTPRFNADVAFEQLAIDALYYIPRRWEENLDEAVYIDALEKYLLDRMRSREQAGSEAESQAQPERAPPDPVGSADAKDEPIPPSEIHELAEMVRRLADYLCDFAALSKAVEAREDGAELAGIVLTAKKRLLARAGSHYKFTLDQLADELAAQKPKDRAATRAPSAEQPQEFLLALRDFLQGAGLNVADLVAGRLLPPTVSDELLRTSIDDLAAAETDGDSTRRTHGLDGRLAFTHALSTHGRRLAAALIMLLQVRHDAGSGETLAGVLAKIARHFRLGDAPLSPSNWTPPLKSLLLHGTAASVNRFKYRFEAYRKAPRRRLPRRSLAKRREASWTAWLAYFRDQFAGERIAQAPFDYADLVLAAHGEAPGCLFRADLADMDAIDWSKAVVAGLSGVRRSSTQDWVMFAGLRALDFDAETMRALSQDRNRPEGTEGEDAIQALILTARSRPGGVLYVYADGAPPRRPFAVPRSRPILAVGYGELHTYMGGLDWLAARGLFEGGMDGTGE